MGVKRITRARTCCLWPYWRDGVYAPQCSMWAYVMVAVCVMLTAVVVMLLSLIGEYRLQMSIQDDKLSNMLLMQAGEYDALVSAQHARIAEGEKAVFDYRNGNFTIISLSQGEGRTYHHLTVTVHGVVDGWPSIKQCNGRLLTVGWRQIGWMPMYTWPVAYIFTHDIEHTLSQLYELFVPYLCRDDYGRAMNGHYSLDRGTAIGLLKAANIPFIEG